MRTGPPVGSSGQARVQLAINTNVRETVRVSQTATEETLPQLAAGGRPVNIGQTNVRPPAVQTAVETNRPGVQLEFSPTNINPGQRLDRSPGPGFVPKHRHLVLDTRPVQDGLPSQALAEGVVLVDLHNDPDVLDLKMRIYF